ncbi:hypothetical protein NUSPORA_02845 [Nucleospora cyclopteri]
MVRINTYSRRNKTLPFILLFNLICYNLCSKWDLGYGKKIKVNKSFPFFKFINNKNFDKIFKTTTYWLNKAKLLFENGKQRAFKEFGITSSSFNTFYLYNILILIPLKNSRSVSFVCYVFHATKPNEIDTNLRFAIEENLDNIIEKRKKILKISYEYKKYIDNARCSFNSKIKTFKFSKFNGFKI